MKPSNLIPAVFLIAGITASGALVATAQTATTADTGAQVITADYDDDDRGERRGWKFGRKGDDHGRRGHGRGGERGMEMRKIFAEVDADDNGEVTQAEIDTYRAAKIGAADASGDGALSIEEFQTLYNDFTRNRMVDAFQRLDEDGDGQISAQELDDRFGNVVERMDRNGDGVLSMKDRRG